MKIKIKFEKLLDFLLGLALVLLGIFYTDAETVRGHQLVIIWIFSGVLLLISVIIEVINIIIKNSKVA